MRCWHKLTILAVFSLSFSLAGQSQETRIVDFGADVISVDPSIGDGVKRMLGNVWLKHKNMSLTCDSAYLDQSINKFIGFSRVHIIKADTLHVYSNKLDYDGETELARLEGNVLMDNVKETLKAPHLDYNMKDETAVYFGGGQIIDSLNTVESFWGYYYLKLNEFVFKENVTVTNPDNTLITDSLRYNSKTENMSFEGPTEVFSDTNYIACNRGRVDSKNRISSFSQDVFMQAKQQNLRTDSLIYDQAGNFTEAFCNIILKDTVENMIIKGDHLFYDELNNRFQVTEDVLYIMTGEKDSLFLHSDTLISTREDETKSRRIQAFPHVQFYRKDIQGRCDSLDYLVIDSLIQLFKKPVIWQDNNQLTADTLGIRLGLKGIDRMEMRSGGFMITREDSTLYNQIKGKTITGYFQSDQLHLVEVIGNGESLFYPKDGTQIIGHNKALSSTIRIIFLKGKIDKISFITDPDSKLTPLKQLTASDLYLDGFEWLDEKRPKTRDDIRIWK
jgi:lipopolysaccharide export system protein LptA